MPRPHHNSKPLAAAVVLFSWLPLIGVGVLVGYVFGWRAAAAIALVGLVLLAQLRADQRRQRTGERRSRAGTALAMVFMTLVGGIAGGFLLGYAGAFGGAMMGFIMVLAQVPLSVKDEHGELREFDPGNPVQSARFYKQVTFLVIGSVALCAIGVTVATVILVARST